MIDMKAARGALIEESRELLDAMDAALLELEQGGVFSARPGFRLLDHRCRSDAVGQ